MSRQNQTYLGISPQGTLAIVPPPPPPPKSPGKCFISNLPDELLVQILEHLILPMPFHTYSECKAHRLLAIVSVRWQRLFDPIFYRVIDFGWSGWQSRVVPHASSGTCKTRPHLTIYIQSLWCIVWSPGHATCRLVAGVLRLCKMIRKLTLYVDMTATVRPLIYAATALPRLEELCLDGTSTDSEKVG